jgi:hypothetical protein
MTAFCQIYAQWDQIGSRMEEEARYLLGLGLIGDATFRCGQGEARLPVLKEVLHAGGLCAPNLYPVQLDPSARDPNWWRYDEQECMRLLARAKDEYARLGLGPLRAVNTYTPGNAFVSACRRSGIRYILGFCSPTVGEDADWRISHYGSPLSPYFVSDDDFRKPAPHERDDAVIISPMEMRNPMVCLSHWNEGPWCPLNALAADRWLEPSENPLPFLQVAEDWLRQSELTGRPLFFILNLQYFFAGRCYDHNRVALQWLAEQKRLGRLEVGGVQQWEKHLRAHGGFQRQTSYWRGEMMGFHTGHRPGLFPDVIVDESLEGQKVWLYPDLLPSRYYDYRERWDYPAFQPDGTAPASKNFADLEVKVSRHETGQLERHFAIQISNSGPNRRVPLVLWDALEGWENVVLIESLSEGWSAEWQPHPSGVGGAILVEGDAKPGLNGISLKAVGTVQSGQVFSRKWGSLVAAETFFHRGRPVTWLVAQTPDPFDLRLRVGPVNRHAIIREYLIGLDHRREELEGGAVSLHFNGSRLACWHRFWGVTAGELELFGVAEEESRLSRETALRVASLLPKLKVDGPGYQLFGNIRDDSRWDRSLARAAGEREIRQMNGWLRRQRADVGDVVIEAHPGAFLPRGSITKVLGGEFDAVSCAAGHGFRALCADYPQGWDWGVAGWVQWRHLRVKLDGLKPQDGPYHLHMHAFDPEGRDITQRICLFDPDRSETAPLLDIGESGHGSELTVVEEWKLPVGLEGRWKGEALCSVKIPDQCVSWQSIGVWIVPCEEPYLHDWMAEKGAPGILCHLWVTTTAKSPARRQ